MVAFPGAGLIHVPSLGCRRGRASHVLLLRVEMLLLCPKTRRIVARPRARLIESLLKTKFVKNEES